MHREPAQTEPEKAGERDAGQHVERPAPRMEVVADGTRRTVFFLPETV